MTEGTQDKIQRLEIEAAIAREKCWQRIERGERRTQRLFVLALVLCVLSVVLSLGGG